MTTFHRLIIDGETYYREVNESTDMYHGDLACRTRLTRNRCGRGQGAPLYRIDPDTSVPTGGP